MAVVKYGAIVTEIKGKVGGTTFQGGRSAPVVKNKKKAVLGRLLSNGLDSNSPLRQSQLRFSQVAVAWRGLTTVEKDSWDALIPIWLFVNKFGDTYEGTAFQIFQSANSTRLQIGQSVLATAPPEAPILFDDLRLNQFELSADWVWSFPISSPTGQTDVTRWSYPVVAGAPFSKARFKEQKFLTTISGSFIPKRAEYEASVGSTPPLGSEIIVEVYTTLAAYPRIMFKRTERVPVVS